MKKILFLIAMVAMIAAVASAQMAVSISGAVNTEIGIDLDTMDTGIQIAGDGVNIKITPALDADGKTAAGADDGDTMYGEIGISGIGMTIQNGWNAAYNSHQKQSASSAGADDWKLAWGKMYAKLVLGNIEIMMKEDTGTGINFQGQGEWNWYLVNAYKYEIFDGQYGGTNNKTSLAVYNGGDDWDHKYFDVHGINDSITVDDSIGIKINLPDIMSVQVDVGSRDSWASTTYLNDYAFKAGINLTAVEKSYFRCWRKLCCRILS